jgi:aminotransferase
VSLGVGEPDFITPWNIREAAINAIKEGRTSYTPNAGLLVLRQELSRYLKKNCGLVYNPADELAITVGVSEALDVVFRTILNPGDEVIMTDPGFVAYHPSVFMAGGEPVCIPINMENAFELNPDDFEARITDKTKAILIGYPANPTGAIMHRDKLLRIAEIAKRHDVLVVSDEIYSRLVYGIEHTCLAALPGMQWNTILINGLSKSHAMTGWRIGFIAADKELLAAMVKIHQYAIICAPHISQLAAIEALRTGEQSVQEMVSEYDKRRKVIIKGLNDIGLDCFEPRGAFYTFPSIKNTGMTSMEFCERALDEAQVGVVPGTAFGANGEGHIRCSYATSLANIEEALSRLERFLKSLRK